MLLAICCRVMPSLAAFQVWGETYVFVDEQPAKQTTAKRNKVIVYFMVLMRPNVNSRAYRPPPEAGAGSESSVEQTGAPETEVGSGGSCAAILFGMLFIYTSNTAAQSEFRCILCTRTRRSFRYRQT